MPPKNPFCCISNTLPHSLTHLISLLPRQTTYIPLASSYSPNALFASFLTATVLSSVYSKEGLEDVTLESWRAVVKLERVSLDGKGQGEGKGLRLRGEEGVSYWVPYGGEDQRKFEIGKKETLIIQRWKEISASDAQESLREEGSGITVGDGEVWVQLEGVEKLWCEKHGWRWEIRVWVRTS